MCFMYVFWGKVPADPWYVHMTSQSASSAPAATVCPIGAASACYAVASLKSTATNRIARLTDCGADVIGD